MRKPSFASSSTKSPHASVRLASAPAMRSLHLRLPASQSQLFQHTPACPAHLTDWLHLTEWLMASEPRGSRFGFIPCICEHLRMAFSVPLQLRPKKKATKS